MANIPRSPWAQRMGDTYGYEQGKNAAIIHSGIAPEFPRLHPKLYADLPINQGRPQSGEEIDLLFRTETFQRSIFRGLESWQAGSLMQQVRFSSQTGFVPGGHRAADYGEVENLPSPGPGPREMREDIAFRIYNAERIQVDESKWFSFLRRDRWLDLDQPEPLLGGNNWSVDNPQVWEFLSIQLELANRIINALIVDRHVLLETWLFGFFCPWDYVSTGNMPLVDSHFLLSYPYHKKICDDARKPCAADFVTSLTERHWRERLETLLKDQTWTFAEAPPGIYAQTYGPYKALIGIGVHRLRDFLKGDQTLSEICITQFIQAVTMVHELFHAIHYRRKIDTTWPPRDPTWPPNLPSLNLLPVRFNNEPYIDDDGAVEAGFAAENRLFGGIPTMTVDRFFAPHIHTWPAPYIYADDEERIQGHPSFQQGKPTHIFPLPAFEASRLLSSEFWDDQTYPNKSNGNFRFSPVVESSTLWYRPFDVDSFQHNRVQLKWPFPDPLQPGQSELIMAWTQRDLLWTQQRSGWYHPYKRTWSDSPWGQSFPRKLIYDFVLAFEERDEMHCRMIAEQLTFSVPTWASGKRDLYINMLPPNSPWPHNWIWHAIGLLMLAAIPMRDHDLIDPTEIEVYTRHIPSKTATSLQEVVRQYRERKSWDVVGPSFLWDPLGPTPGLRLNNAAALDQETCFLVYNHLLTYLRSSGAIVSRPWLVELERLKGILRWKRALMRQQMPNQLHRQSWVDTWDLRPPAYDNTMAQYQNGYWAELTPVRPYGL